MKRCTKIVCTLGPAVGSRERIGQLVEAGMNVARLNCSHGDWETRAAWLDHLRSFRREMGPVGAMADLQGPKFRIGDIAGGEIALLPGESLTVGQAPSATITVPGDKIFDAMQTGNRLLLGDGDVELRLGARTGGVFEAKAVTGGPVKSRQGITLVGRSFEVPALTDKDRDDARAAISHGVDFIALSYVRRAADLIELRELVSELDPGVHLCAKIETREALKNIDGIIEVADVIMVARGDLGLQIDLEDVPLAQKSIIRKCAQAGKPVITATQMLESMIHASRPTRAETTDVFNAILDGSDAVMLSGETAAGEYPIEAVRTMGRIIEKAEGAFDYAARTDAMECGHGNSQSTEAVAQAAGKLATTLRVKAVVATSTSGLTARMVAKYRPRSPILCATSREQTHRQLSVAWGVEAAYVRHVDGTEAAIQGAIEAFVRMKRLKVGDTIVVTAGVPTGSAGSTNLILFETVK